LGLPTFYPVKNSPFQPCGKGQIHVIIPKLELGRVFQVVHHESDPATDGHGPNWYKEVERLGGEVIQDLQEDLDNL